MVNIIGKRVGIQDLTAPASDGSASSALAAVGKALFGDTLTPALKREQMQKLADQNELTKFAVDNIGSDGNFVNPRAASISAALGAIDPAKMGRQQALDAYRTGGVDSDLGQRLSTGLGEFNATPMHQGRALQNNIVLKGIEEQNKLNIQDAALREVQGENGPVFARNRDAVGQSPVLSADQVKAGVQQRLLPDLPVDRQQDYAFGAQSPGELGVATTASGTVPAFVRSNGIFNAQDGGKIEEPVTSFGKLVGTSADSLKPTDEPLRQIRDGRVATENALNQIATLKNELAKPDAGAAMGALGSVAGTFNYIRAQTEAAAKLLNPQALGFSQEIAAPEIAGTIDSYIKGNPQIIQKAQSLGIDTAVLRSQIQNLAYVIAKTNDPTGRLGVQDVQSAIHQIGGSLGDPVAMGAVLDNLGNSVATQHETRERVFKSMYGDKLGVPAWQRPGAASAGVTSSGASVAPSPLKQKYGLE